MMEVMQALLRSFVAQFIALPWFLLLSNRTDPLAPSRSRSMYNHTSRTARCLSSSAALAGRVEATARGCAHCDLHLPRGD
jgi:hypothetical protein